MENDLVVRNAGRYFAISRQGSSMEFASIESVFLAAGVVAGKAASLVVLLLLVLFASTSSAQATVESVAPIKLWCDAYNKCNFTSDTAAVQATIAKTNVDTGGGATWYFYGCDGGGVCIVQIIYAGGYTIGKTNYYVKFIPSCPVASVNPSVLYEYKPATGMCERTVQETCPIADLSADPADPNGLEALITQYDKTEDEKLLTRKLEDKFDAYSLLSQQTRDAEHCLAGRVANELLQDDSGYKVTSTVRTLAYQAHLLDVWNKFWELKSKVKETPTIKQMCPALIAKIEGEMGVPLNQNPTTIKPCAGAGRNHCIVQQPADIDPKHTKDIAFDISKTTVKKFESILLPPRTMVTEANACKLTWGGTFTDAYGKPKPDPVHFVCCVK
jgi:hypothetical protein